MKSVVYVSNTYRLLRTTVPLLIQYYSSVGNSNLHNAVTRFPDQCLPSRESGVSTVVALEISYFTSPNLVPNQALGTRAYESSRIESQSTAAPISGAGGLTSAGGSGEEGLSADHQLLCQIGNCLQLDTVRSIMHMVLHRFSGKLGSIGKQQCGVPSAGVCKEAFRHPATVFYVCRPKRVSALKRRTNLNGHADVLVQVKRPDLNHIFFSGVPWGILPCSATDHSFGRSFCQSYGTLLLICSMQAGQAWSLIANEPKRSRKR